MGGVPGPRACLKIHSRHLHPLICGIFLPNSVNVARYASFIWQKSPTNCRIHLSESNFQTRSSGGTGCGWHVWDDGIWERFRRGLCETGGFLQGFLPRFGRLLLQALPFYVPPRCIL
ncbi:DUF6783 domain-containing protein [Lachnospiraceae bacterium JLR.KK009]